MAYARSVARNFRHNNSDSCERCGLGAQCVNRSLMCVVAGLTRIAAAARALTAVLCCCWSCTGAESPRVLPHDSSRGENVSLRELYGQAVEHKVACIWLDDEKSSDSIPPASVTHHSDQAHVLPAHRSAVLLTAPTALHTAPSISPDSNADVSPPSADTSQLCSGKQNQDSVMVGACTVNYGHSPSCSEDYEYTTALRNLETEVTQSPATVTLSGPGLTSQQVDALLSDKDALQNQVGALQRQLTWLQSHADLQDRINKELLDEVMHLRDAYATASLSP